MADIFNICGTLYYYGKEIKLTLWNLGCRFFACLGFLTDFSSTALYCRETAGTTLSGQMPLKNPCF